MAQSQQTIRTIKSLSLEDYVPGGGQVRDDLLPKLGTIVRSEFSVDFELVYEVHGSYDKGDKDNASLLVIRIVPRPDNLRRQFLWFKITLTVLSNVTNGQGGNEDADDVPLLTSIEPASSGDQFADVLTTNETRETALKGSLQAQIYGVTPGIEGSRSSKSEFKAYHWLRVKSGTNRTNLALSRKQVNCVWWEVRAACLEDGIGDSFTVALLVKRPAGSKFRIEANTDGEIGVLSEKLKRFVPSGLRSKKDPSLLDVFGPRAGSVQRVPKGIDENNLHAASIDKSIKHIEEVGLHLQEQGRLVRFEQGIAGSRLELESLKKSGDETSSATDTQISKQGAMPQAQALQRAEQPLSPTPAPPSSAVPEVEPSTPKLERTEGDAASQPSPVFPEPYPQLGAQAPPTRQIYSTARIERLRKMAALYDRLADLLREEARECLSAEERAYADEVERQGW